MTTLQTLEMALEALENGRRVRNFEGGTKYQPDLEDTAIAALRQQIALEKKAENARELGLDYEPADAPVANNKFTKGWINISELPGGMMCDPEGLYGPIPGSTSCWVTTSERERDRLASEGKPMLQIYTRPQPAAQWVGLTMEDKQEYVALDYGGNRLDAMDWAEKRLKEKNT